MSDLTLPYPTKKISDVALVDPENLPESTPYNYRLKYIDLSAVSVGSISDNIDWVTFEQAPSRARRVVKKGDVLMSTVRPNLQGFAKLNEVASSTVASTGFAVIRASDDFDNEFLYQNLFSDSVTAQIEALVVGSNYPAINSSEVRNLLIPAPDLRSQQKIAKFLNTVDNLIEKTQALIDKYSSIKQGMMADLFTRGIDLTAGPNYGKLRPNVEDAPELYKESELGWVPKDWEVKNLGDISSISSGITLGNEYSETDAVEVPYLRVANVQDGYLDLSEVKIVKIPPSHVAKYLLEVGDVLMNEGGDFDKLGRGTIWDGEVKGCCHQNHVFKVRTYRTELFPEYLAYWSASSFGKSYFIMNSKQSTNLASINSSQLKKFPVLVPPLIEQEMIIKRLLASDGNISKLEFDIDKNKRVKKGLMQDLLTGTVLVK